jgi:predicted RNA binding protein YcfA (HicA-like mRNA interferase family)
MSSKERFPDVRNLLEGAGYELVRVNGSHHIFTKPGESLVSIPVHHGNVKAFYVRQIEKILQGR